MYNSFMAALLIKSELAIIVIIKNARHGMMWRALFYII
jgi:hypothetical protein